MTEEQKQALIEVQRYSVFEGWVVADKGGRLVTYEAFLALAQRAEAAEAKQAELAELAKQRNPDYFLNRIESSDKWGLEVELRIYESQLDASKSQDDHGGGIIELFTRPAPAVGMDKPEPYAWLVHAPQGDYVERNPEVVAHLEGTGLTKCKPLYLDL